MPLFSKSHISTECDSCKRLFPLTTVGVCTRCRRILCHAHLHGSFAQRLLVDLLRMDAVCVECRTRG